MPARTGSDGRTESAVKSAPRSIAKAAESISVGYKGGEDMPLGAFSALMGAYGLAMGGFFLAAKLTKREMPKVSIGDIALLGVATHKVSRLVTKDWVTSPIRAPFTEYQGDAGSGEVKESPRGTGMQRATGALFT